MKLNYFLVISCGLVEYNSPLLTAAKKRKVVVKSIEDVAEF